MREDATRFIRWLEECERALAKKRKRNEFVDWKLMQGSVVAVVVYPN